MEQRIELAPNCSLTVAGAKLFFGATCLFSLAFALLFVIQGFWPVLPFWALEMLALGLALNASMRRRRYTQTLLITDSLVSLVTRSRRGTESWTSAPSPGAERTTAEPPKRAMRARMDWAMPCLSSGTAAGSKPRPRSRT